MHPYSDDEVGTGPAAIAKRREIARQRLRSLKIAKLSFAGGAAGVLFLCLCGMRPAALSIPVSLAVFSLLFAAASAALFARVARLYLEDSDQGPEDEDGGPGRGWSWPSEPPGGGNLVVDWNAFERDFWAYCGRVTARKLIEPTRKPTAQPGSLAP